MAVSGCQSWHCYGLGPQVLCHRKCRSDCSLDNFCAGIIERVDGDGMEDMLGSERACMREGDRRRFHRRPPVLAQICVKLGLDRLTSASKYCPIYPTRHIQAGVSGRDHHVHFLIEKIANLYDYLDHGHAVAVVCHDISWPRKNAGASAIRLFFQERALVDDKPHSTMSEHWPNAANLTFATATRLVPIGTALKALFCILATEGMPTIRTRYCAGTPKCVSDLPDVIDDRSREVKSIPC